MNKMKTVPVSFDATQFLHYCQQYGKEHDESFLPQDTFMPDDDHPTYLLFEAIRAHFQDIDYVYGFLPEEKVNARRCWESLGFTIERFSYVLTYRAQDTPEVRVPEGYDLVSLQRTDKMSLHEFCTLWNRNYAGTPGAMGATPEYLLSTFDESLYLPDGTLLLRHGDRPVGTVHVCRDEQDAQAAFVDMVSVHPDYRGQGLGRLLLRSAIQVARQNGLYPVSLSVNAENESAVELYLSEGFVKDTVMVCYRLNIVDLRLKKPMPAPG